MNESVALPAQPVQPKTPDAPTLTTPEVVPEKPKALLKRSKDVARAIKQYLRENPSQQLEIEGNKYPRIELWQFAGACFGYTAMVTSTEEIISDHGEELGFISTAHTLNASGRVISGAESACMRSENDWGTAPSFQLRSMAQTRSTAKALRNVLAFVMVQAGLCATPAEEMDPSSEPHFREFKTPCSKSDCPNSISDKRRLETRKKYGAALCIDCEKKEKAKKGDAVMSPINDPAFVQQSVDEVKKRKANGGAPTLLAAIENREQEYA